MENKLEISFVTTIEKIEKGEIDGFNFPETGRIRCIGFFKTTEEAIENVKRNGPGYYEMFGSKYIIVETFKEGILTISSKKRTLFKWNGTEYIVTEEPEYLKMLCNFAIN